MKTRVDEVAADVFRISTYVPDVQFQFNQFVIRDDAPLLYHTGPRALFPAVRDAVARVIDPAELRWIAFSHFEADECGALGEWLEVAPRAQPACGVVSAMVSVNDQSPRLPKALSDGEVLETGSRRYRWVPTPHLPHAWDAGHLYEETERILFCSDLLHQMGDVEASTTSDLTGRYGDALRGLEASPFRGYVPYGPHAKAGIARLRSLAPQVLLPMHGSAFRGDGARALADMDQVLAEVLGPRP